MTNAPGPPAARSDAATTELAAALERAWTERGAAPLEEDRRLSALAQWLATSELQGLPFSLSTAEFAAHKMGLPFPAPAALGVTFALDAPRELLEQEIGRSLASLPNNFPYSRYGIGAVDRSDRRVAVFVLSPAEVSFEPIARRLQRGQSVLLRGSVAERFAKAHVSVTSPDGKVHDSVTKGRAFDQRIAVPSPGVYQIELLGDGASGPVVVANFPVYVEVDEPGTPPDDREPAAGGAMTAEAATAKLFALINEERRRAGAPPLVPFEPLAAVALAHSRDMADHGFFGHVSPTTGTTADRITRAGVLLAVFGENVGAGASPEEVHRELMASPAHRAVLLDPRFSHVGIGVVVKKDATAPVIATEVFGKPPQLVDPKAARAELLDQLNAKRQKKGLSPVRSAPELDAAASHGLDLELGNPSADLDQTSNVVAAELGRSGPSLSKLGVRSIGVVGTKVFSFDELLSSELFFDPRVRAVGIAISQPISDQPHQLAVVVLGLGGEPAAAARAPAIR